MRKSLKHSVHNVRCAHPPAFILLVGTVLGEAQTQSCPLLLEGLGDLTQLYPSGALRAGGSKSCRFSLK